ncbi:MAG TPA: SET domain-containing protein-lysine N-methyltransferase [Steroidobacter sp.]
MATKNRRTQSRTRPSSKSTRGPQKKSVRKARRPAAKKKPVVLNSPLVEARNSQIHGRGVYAIVPIKKGARVIEYLGERISHGEADARYEKKGDDDGHTFLFIASNRTVIDAGTDGNDARFINHSCNPNCETVIENSRVFIDAIRNIKAGEELGYDYQLTWESTDDPAELALYGCRCGAKKCRGTMLDKEPTDLRDAKKKAKKKAKKR